MHYLISAPAGPIGCYLTIMYLKTLRQTFRRVRKMEVIGLLLILLGSAGCVSAAALGIPGLLTASLLCIAGIGVVLMA